MSQQVIKRGRYVDGKRHLLGIGDVLPAHSRRQVNDQRNAQDLRMHAEGVHVVPNFAQGLAMVGGEYNDAVVVKLPLLEIRDELPKAAIQPLDLRSVSGREG